jgi:hypothetical protein
VPRPLATPKNHTITSVPAPIGGLNARDSIANMDPTDAVALENWIPDSYGVRCRKGFVEWAINFPAGKEVQSILSWFGPATTFPSGSYLINPTSLPGKVFAATPDGLYDITSPTNVPVITQALSGSTYAGWFSSSMLTNVAGSFLLAASEDDGYFYYDGAVWSKPTMGGGAGQISGVDPADLCFVLNWKRRVWFVEKDTTRAWYLATDAITGTASSFDFGSLFPHGGKLAYLASWTIDAGEGIDDFFVAVSSNGDVLIYKGTDPASATAFGIVGAYYVGQIPEGRRAFCQYGGDLIIVSTDGVVPVSMITRGGAGLLVASNKEYSTKIRPLIGSDLRASFTMRGWDAFLHPSERLLIVGVPDYSETVSSQYAMSTSQNQWCNFSGIPAYSYGNVGGYTLTGTRDGRVLLLFSSFFDNVPYGASAGDGIRGVIQPAFSAFGTPALEKQFLMIRPVMLSADTPSVSIDVNVNYQVNSPAGTLSFSTDTGSLWDTAFWDTAVWGGSLKTFSEWASVSGIGFAGAASILTTTLADSVLASIDYCVMSGGPL